MFRKMSDLVGTAGDEGVDAALSALVSPVQATAREAAPMGELISVDFSVDTDDEFEGMAHSHGNTLDAVLNATEWCEVCAQCDHSIKRECGDCSHVPFSE